MDYVSFKEHPSRDWPGSYRLWHSYRIVHSMYVMWENLNTDEEKGRDSIKRARLRGSWEAGYIPQKKRSKKGKKKGQDAP